MTNREAIIYLQSNEPRLALYSNGWQMLDHQTGQVIHTFKQGVTFEDTNQLRQFFVTQYILERVTEGLNMAFDTEADTVLDQFVLDFGLSRAVTVEQFEEQILPFFANIQSGFSDRISETQARCSLLNALANENLSE